MKKIIALFILIVMSSSVFGLSISFLQVSPSKIEPGNSATIMIQIENEEDFDIQGVTIKLDLSDPSIPIATISTCTEKLIVELDEEDQEYVYFEVTVLPSAVPGVYKIPVIITYEDDDGEIIVKNEVIGLEIYSNPDLSILVSDPDFLLDKVSEIEFEVTNKGLSDVNFLNFILKDSSFYDIISSDEVYIGKLSSDDFDRVDFKIMLNYPIPTNVPFLVELEYYDSSNVFHKEEFNINKRVYTLSEAKLLGLVDEEKGSSKYLFFALILLIGIGYRKFKKKKRKIANF